MIRLAALLAVVAAAPVWPAPQNPMQLTRKAGLTPETHEFVFLHVHSHLDVFDKGKRIVVPAGIGINVRDKAVHKFTNPQDGTIGYGTSARKQRMTRVSRHFSFARTDL